ncbi:HlyD family type I secretion periplasmic adaptor subunit [Rhodobacteraceae bacterium W635]|uniref:HlyD family type I secretion periplasmic adaptor subunit n=1 Tax=Nioella halotolerans TaxID=2303578 RepID=UPI000E3C8E66|nr:HlyD family type I secretion periplasmic adaptor subunit [Rhodobacteraceae bacterium W635]
MTEARKSWSVRRPMLLGMITLFVLVGGFGAWAALSNIAGAVIASGRIEVDQNRQAVQHPEGGVVQTLDVVEGQLVEAGDILMRLDPSDIASALSVADAQLNEWRARQARLEAERDLAAEITFPDDLLAAADAEPNLAELLDGQRNLFAARAETLVQETDQLSRRANQIRAQIRGFASQRAALVEQRDLVQAELVNVQDLIDRGLSETSRGLSLRRESARLMGSIGELDASTAEAEGRITEIEMSILQLETQRREDAIEQLREVRVQLAELSERVQTLSRQLDRMDLRAPVTGVVYGLAVTGPRAVVQAAEPVLSLVPQDRPLVISTRIVPNNIDEVFVGQDVTLRFPAFDMRTTPDLFGRVRHVSADTFVDEATGASYYEAQILLNEGEIGRLDGETLLPGMQVEAFIRTRDQTPLAYLLRPLTDYFNRAFREG